MPDDRDLKVRLSTIFWVLGCYTRLAVKLAEYSPQRDMPLELTDLDVLGIRITPERASVGCCLFVAELVAS